MGVNYNVIENLEKFKSHIFQLLIGCTILSVINYRYISYIIVYFILHLIIDIFIKWLNGNVNKNTMIYLVYQGLHIILIYLIGEIIVDKNFSFQQFVSEDLLRWILFIFIILKPINITFKALFNKYAPDESGDTTNAIEGAGAMIGNLERLLIAILMFYNQFGAIGLVFTAKSVARFDKISKNPAFAEYYLIGSLYSIISVLTIYGIIIY